MLSLARNHAAGKCFRCAIHSQRLALQQIRMRTGPSAKGGPPPKFRYTGGAYGRTRREDGERQKSFGEPRGRKFGKPQKPYPELLQERLKAMRNELKEAPIVDHYLKEKREEGDKKMDFGKLWQSFQRELGPVADVDERLFSDSRKSAKTKVSLADELREAFSKRGHRGLDDRIKYAFYGHVTGSRFTASDVKNQKGLADLRYPSEWFPGTRQMHRTIHLHVGPTNSGKTYHALKRLEQAESGVYAGPLRLLAHEVYTRMMAKGKSCALITGEERRVPEVGENGEVLPYLSSCTVEMVPFNVEMDVAVIDEIQMIGSHDRGWAWTQALLGVRAKEVHLCGEARTVPLIKELCAGNGDKLEIHRYERLSPLKVADESLDGKIHNLEKGDCIVSFSVMGIHGLRRQIERVTGKKVATVYGSLPPETRAAQAKLFNDPDNDYDFLVASDAVGMGLNLAIKRIIFEASNKFDGTHRRTLPIADIKQIAGRAGRYRTAAQATEETAASQALAAAKGEDVTKVKSPDSVGLVTTLEKFDFPVVRAAMEMEPEPIQTAGLFPPETVLERFSNYFPPGTPFSYILTRLHELSIMHKRFHLCGLRDQVWIADLIEPIQNLTVADRNVICSAPASKTDNDLWQQLMPAYAKIIAEQSGGNLIDIPELPLEILDAPMSANREYLRELERLHKGIVTYLWLSYRFAGIFSTRALAFHVKTMVEEKIEEVLNSFSFSETQRRKLAAKREQELLEAAQSDEGLGQSAGEGENVRAAQDEDQDFSEDDEDVSQRDYKPDPEVSREQTTYTSGGDRFGGEEAFAFEEPAELDAEFEAQKETQPERQEDATASFAAWRNRQTKGESQGSHEPEGEALENAHQQGEEAGRDAVRNATFEDLAASEPTVADAEPDVVIAEESPRSAKATSQEQDPLDLGASITHETDLPSDKPPVATQEVSPATHEAGHVEEGDKFGDGQKPSSPSKHQ